MSAIRLTEEQYAVQQAREWRKDRNHFERVEHVRQIPAGAEFNESTGIVTFKSKPEPKPLEKDIQREIRDALRKHSAVAHVFRVNSGAQLIEPENGPRRFVRYHDIPGMSDLWCLLKPPHAPRQAFIEVKRPGAEPTFKQAAFLELMSQLGHVAFVASNAADAYERLSLELAA